MPALVASARSAPYEIMMVVPYEIMMVVPSIAIDNVVIIAGTTL
jgi:hypothetical protein